MWFEELTGFREINPTRVRQNLAVNGPVLTSLVNGKEYHFGKLEVPTLDELRQSLPSLGIYKDKIKISEIVGNVQAFHKEVVNEGAFFQAASQFNLLEMVGPEVTPERGIGIYENDHTQGPACAIACGAGTIFRNYFVEVNGQIGQTASNQIDCLDEIGKALNNDMLNLWRMKNGYALADLDGLENITRQINQKTPEEYETLKGKLKIGIMSDTEVTLSANKHRVTQAYCSALPVAYSHTASRHWKTFAQLVLDASYEASFYAALANAEKTGNKKVFLTLVGGGAFGNETIWIFDAIRKAVEKFQHTPLDIKIVSYGSSKPEVKSFVQSFQ